MITHVVQIYTFIDIYIYSKHIVNRMNYTASLVVIIYMLYYHDMDMNVKNIYRHKYRYIYLIYPSDLFLD